MWRERFGSSDVAAAVDGSSGAGPEQALEAITPLPRAQRESRSSPELPCERRTVPAEPQDASTPAPGSFHSPTESLQDTLSPILLQWHPNSTEWPLLCKYEGPTPFEAHL